MINIDQILHTFKFKNTLNPKIWDNPNNPKNAKLKNKVSEALINIAEEFMIHLGNDVFADDIILTGSLSNYNWSEYSDFDLHVVINYDNYGEQKDAFSQLFNLKKQIFNEKHDIRVLGYEVEVYPQSLEEKHYSIGVYSLMYNSWITMPTKETKKIDFKILKNKIADWKSKISNSIETMDAESIKKTVDKLKKYRLSGLESEGEFSYENLVFKYLRRSGVIEKLYNAMNKSLDKKLSLSESKKNKEL